MELSFAERCHSGFVSSLCSFSPGVLFCGAKLRVENGELVIKVSLRDVRCGGSPPLGIPALTTPKPPESLPNDQRSLGGAAHNARS